MVWAYNTVGLPPHIVYLCAYNFVHCDFIILLRRVSDLNFQSNRPSLRSVLHQFLRVIVYWHGVRVNLYQRRLSLTLEEQNLLMAERNGHSHNRRRRLEDPHKCRNGADCEYTRHRRWDQSVTSSLAWPSREFTRRSCRETSIPGLPVSRSPVGRPMYRWLFYRSYQLIKNHKQPTKITIKVSANPQPFRFNQGPNHCANGVIVLSLISLVHQKIFKLRVIRVCGVVCYNMMKVGIYYQSRSKQFLILYSTVELFITTRWRALLW